MNVSDSNFSEIFSLSAKSKKGFSGFSSLKLSKEDFLEKDSITQLGLPPLRIDILNDLDGGTLFQPENYFVEDSQEYMVGLQYPYQIKVHVASTDFKNLIPEYPEKKKELEKLANSLKETDNPVLVLVRIKK